MQRRGAVAQAFLPVSSRLVGSQTGMSKLRRTGIPACVMAADSLFYQTGISELLAMSELQK